MNRRAKRFVPQVPGLEDRIALADGPDIEPVTMEPLPYTYSDWYDAFKNLISNIDDLVIIYVTSPDEESTYVDDALSSPYLIQP
jgi:hypothetical protein